MLGKLLDFVIGREPVQTAAVVTAVVGLAVAFGLNLSEEQTAAISGAVAVILGWVARAAVTPVRHPEPPPVPGVPQ